jgi:coenzyme F420-reducing hydrogenase alpha subunit
MFMRKATRALLGLALGLAVTLPALAAAAKDIESTPQAKVYRANAKAIATADYDGYKKTMSAEAQSKMDAQVKEMKKTNKEVMEFMKMMSPTDIKLTDLKVDGKKATLSMMGKSDGQMMKGSADMVEEGGGWKMGQQSWSNAK